MSAETDCARRGEVYFGVVINAKVRSTFYNILRICEKGDNRVTMDDDWINSEYVW